MSSYEKDIRGRLDEEIEILEAHIVEVRRQIAVYRQMQNRLVPLHKLPTEILSHILQMATLSDCFIHVQFQNQLNLERVCIWWKKLMDAIPRIFSGASRLRNERIIAESGDLPLHIAINGYQEDFMNFIETHIHRWGSFRAPSFGCDPCLRHFHQPAPLLRTFEVQFFQRLTSWHHVMDPFQGKAPLLQRLSFLLPIQWNNGLLRGLRSLHVWLKLDGDGIPYGYKLRQVLQDCPLLQELVLDGPCFSQTGDPTPLQHRSKVIVHLPELRVLRLMRVGPLVVRWFLDSIRAPSLEDLCIRCYVPDLPELTTMFEKLPMDGVFTRVTEFMKSKPMRMTLGDDDGNHCIRVKTAEVSCDPELREILALWCNMQELRTFKRNLFDCAAAILPSWAPFMRSLSVCDGNYYRFPPNYGETIGAFLVELVGLEELVVSHHKGDKGITIINALGTSIGSKDQTSRRWPCPRLKDMLLVGKRWLDVPKLYNSLSQRYGALESHETIRHDLPLDLPIRLEKLAIEAAAKCSDSGRGDKDDDFTMNMLTALVGSTVVEIVCYD
ncbi:hypothetical protein FRC03_004656 [Tulasnella sp. 419]|nr:hypothetical protein FRC03_004656 [Tulasnella sp. 419]